MELVKYLLDAMGPILLLMPFVPGFIAFLSIRQGICSFVGVIAALAVTRWIRVTYRNGVAYDPDSLLDVLTIFCSMTVCFTLCWVVMHFVLPKTLLSNVSERGKAVVSIITLFVVGVLMVLRFLNVPR